MPEAAPSPSQSPPPVDPVRDYRLPLDRDERALLSLVRPEPVLPAEAGADWEVVGALARLHRLEARLHHVVQTRGARIPPAVARQLQSAYFRDLHANVTLLHRRDRAVHVLAEAGVRPMVVKGAALADSLYTDPAVRPMGDIDLLLPAGSTTQALAALSEAHIDLRGYEIEERHHDLTMDGMYPFDFEGMWAEARPAPFGGGEALVPAPEDQLLLVAVSCCRNSFWNLLIILDAAELVHCRGSEIDWDRLERRLRDVGLTWAMDTLLALSAALYAVEAPAEFRRRIAPAAWRRRAIGNLLAGYRLRAEGGLESVNIPRPMGAFALKYAVNTPRIVGRQLRQVAFPPWTWMRAHYPDSGRAALIARYALHPFVLGTLALRFLLDRLKNR